MTRRLAFALFVLACLGLVMPLGTASAEEKPAADKEGALPQGVSKPLTLASDEEVAAALKEFKVNYKAAGLPKEDKTSQRDWAMQQIAPLQHPDVVDALGKITRSSDPDLRMLAMIYLGDQKALPHQAAKYILAAMKKGKKDTVVLMTGLQSLGNLRYLGAGKEITALLKHRDYAVKREAIATIGNIRDIRLLSEMLQIIGMKVETDVKKQEAKAAAQADKKESKKETVEEGYSWEGAEATVDRGEADNTQENADAKKQAEAQIAQNKAAAEAAAGGSSGPSMGGGSSSSGGGSLGGGGMSGGRGGASRSTDELHPVILQALKKLTGQEFDHPSVINKWLAENFKAVANNEIVLDEKEEAQKKAK